MSRVLNVANYLSILKESRFFLKPQKKLILYLIYIDFLENFQIDFW